MNAVIALLDHEHTFRIQALWEELARDFGVRVIRKTVPWPHVTFHGAERYALDRIASALGEIADRTAQFSMHAEGLAIFSGPQPVLYVPVTRDATLNRLHATLWKALAPSSEQIAPDYAPVRWIAHITLAQWDMPAATLGAVVARLAERPIDWEIEVSALGLITGVGAGSEATYSLRQRYDLRGTSGNAAT